MPLGLPNPLDHPTFLQRARRWVHGRGPELALVAAFLVVGACLAAAIGAAP